MDFDVCIRTLRNVTVLGVGIAVGSIGAQAAADDGTWTYCVGSTYDNQNVGQVEYFAGPFPSTGTEDDEGDAFKACVENSYPEARQFTFYAGCNNTSSEHASHEIQFKTARAQSAGGRTVQTSCHPG